MPVLYLIILKRLLCIGSLTPRYNPKLFRKYLITPQYRWMVPRHREATCFYELNSKKHPYQEAKHTLKKARSTQWFLQGLREGSMWLSTETDQEPWSLATPP